MILQKIWKKYVSKLIFITFFAVFNKALVHDLQFRAKISSPLSEPRLQNLQRKGPAKASCAGNELWIAGHCPVH